MIDRALIGLTTPEYPVEVERGRIRQFAAAIGENDPIYHDEAAARAAGHPGILAPPTFGFTLGLMNPHSLNFEKLGLKLEQILHAEQKFVYAAPIHAGDVIRLRSRLTDVFEKKGGRLEFICITTAARNQHDQMVLEMVNTVVCRHADPS